ncbi:MAG: hypothetical protein D6795_03650 [Deltaproteobacteria bacterium]|nr:MAG: hypothetical protein D6795_03650 [Deltaproteobacteria bacterium]
MYRIVIPGLFFLLLACPRLFAQAPPPPPPQEPIDIVLDGDSGGFGGVTLKPALIDGQLGWLFGGRGGWIIHHVFSLGLAGYSLTSGIEMENVATEDFEPGTPLRLNMAYLGIELTYLVWRRGRLALSVTNLLGAGGVNFKNLNIAETSNQNQAFEVDENNADTVFIEEPGVNLSIDLLEHLRCNLGMSYRLPWGVDVDGLDAFDIGGISSLFSLEFGWF